MDACQQNISEFLGRDIGQWSGLATGCRKEDLAGWLPFSEGAGKAFFGTKNVDYAFRALIHEGFIGPVMFYFHDDELSFMATEFWSLDEKECASLLQQLGEPGDRLDFFWRDEKIESGEWIHVGRGITLGVIPATRLIAKVTIYPPCTLKDYEEKYYNTKLIREFRKTD